MERLLKGVDATNGYAEEFLSALERNQDRATVVGLSGELGSGKTAFVKAIGKFLGAKEEILSPTFVVAKFYELSAQNWKKLVHIDAYRIEEEDEMRPIKWDEILSDKNNLVMMEWPENIKALFPTDAPLLRFRFIDDVTRAITLS